MSVPGNMHTPAMEGHWKFRVAKEKYEAQTGVSRGVGGGGNRKKPSMGEVWIFFLEQDNLSWLSMDSPLLTLLSAPRVNNGDM